MPVKADWEPPYPAYSAVLPAATERVVMAYYAIQHHGDDAAAEAFATWLNASLGKKNAPAVANRARYRTANDLREDVFILYWLDGAAFHAWEQQAESWWLDPARLTGAAGYWREIWYPPLSYLETLLSSESPAGLAEAQVGVRGPIREHAYWGAARDRIPQSATDPLVTAHNHPTLTASPANSKGQRLRVRPSGNLCLIRSGQNWSACGQDELAVYDQDLRPVLQAGMDFLRDNPLETGCLSCRFMNELALDGTPQKKSFGLACFLSLKHLEDWAKSHPTHLAIFGGFHQFVKKRNFEIELKLWHEIAVMPAGSAFGEYLNCDPESGLLPYFTSEAF